MGADEAIGAGQGRAAGPVEVFVSYDPKDEPFLLELEASLAVLVKAGKIRLFSRRGLDGGDEAESTSLAKLNAASLILLLVSHDFLASETCTREAARALDRRAEGSARVIPIPVRPCNWKSDRIGVLTPLPKSGHPIATSPSRDAAWVEVVSGLGSLVDELLPGSSAGAPKTPGPFPGLEPFDEDRALYFFGREAEIAEAIAALGDTPSGHRRWLQIEGPSGAGKSSLARAGLVPAILHRSGIRGAPPTFLRAVLRPGRDPVLSLAHAVSRALRGHLPPGLPLDAVAAEFRASDTALASLLRESVPDRTGFLLLVDQLEEAFTFAEDAASLDRFDALLSGALADKGGPLYLLTTIRTDYVARYGSLPGLEAKLNKEASRYHLRAITPEGLRAAIERPAEQAGLEWEGDLPERIVEDAASSKGSLPLVAHVLWALNEDRELRGGRRLLVEAYRKLGGVGGALAKSADALLESLGEAGRERAKRLLLRLVRVGRGGEEDRRQAALRAEAVEAAGGDSDAERVLLRVSGFRDPDKPDGSPSAPPRLVVVEETAGEAQVSLVHDALLSRWPLLRAIVDEKRKGLTCRDDLEAAVQGWVAAGKPLDGLPGGAQLAYFRGAEGPSALARRFLEAAEAQEQRAILQRAESERQRQLAESRLRDAVGLANGIAHVIDRNLDVIAGAGPVWKELLERVSELQERLLEGASARADVLQSRMVVHHRRGDVARTHDDLALARKEYEAALGIARTLSEADLSNAVLRRDLWVSYTKLGDVARAGGDLWGARGFFEKSLELRKALSEADPSNAVLKRDLWVSYTKLGEVAQAGGDLASARGFFEKGLELRKALSEADPSNAGLKRDLSVSYNRLGAVAQAGGDRSGARGFFEKDLELIKALSEADPSNAEWQVDLVFSHTKLAYLALNARDVPGARIHHAAATALLDRLEQSGRTKGNALAGKLRADLEAMAANLPKK